MRRLRTPSCGVIQPAGNTRAASEFGDGPTSIMFSSDPAIRRLMALRAVEGGLLRLRWLAAATRFEIALRRHDRALKQAYKAGFNPDQPRVPAGNPDGGQWTDEGADSESQTQLAGTVIRICIAGSRSLMTDSWGNKSYWVEYLCAGGRSFTRSGQGHNFRGFFVDPFQ